MKLLKKALVLCMVFVFMVPMFASAEELPAISVLIPCDSAIPAADAPVPAEIAKRAGVNVNWNFVALADHETKLNAYIASNDLPDIFVAGNSLAVDLISHGKLLDMRPLLEEHGANVLADGENKYNFGINQKGAVYGLPVQISYPWAMGVRRDWMENLGYDVAEGSMMEMDISTFTQLMIDFAQNDPDGDGENDTFGFCAEDGSAGMFTPIFAAFGIPLQGWDSMYYDAEAGECYSVLQHPRFAEAMETFRTLYQTGGMDREFAAVADASTEFGYLWNSTAGGASWSPAGTTNNWVSRYTEEGVDENSFIYLNITDDNGENGGYYVGYSASWVCVSASCENPEAAIQLINYLYSVEGDTLAYLGIEGTHYQWTNKEAEDFEYIGIYKEDLTNQRTDGGWIVWSRIHGDNNFELRNLTQITVDCINYAKQHPFDNLAIIRNSQPAVQSEIGSNRHNIVRDAFANMVVFEGDLNEMYADYLAEYEAINGNLYNEQFTEIYKEENGL